MRDPGTEELGSVLGTIISYALFILLSPIFLLLALLYSALHPRRAGCREETTAASELATMV